ncbi:MAG TPA: hypothetical protein VF209_00190 [Patescibacteria group bacterium]
MSSESQPESSFDDSLNTQPHFAQDIDIPIDENHFLLNAGQTSDLEKRIEEKLEKKAKEKAEEKGLNPISQSIVLVGKVENSASRYSRPSVDMLVKLSAEDGEILDSILHHITEQLRLSSGVNELGSVDSYKDDHPDFADKKLDLAKAKLVLLKNLVAAARNYLVKLESEKISIPSETERLLERLHFVFTVIDRMASKVEGIQSRNDVTTEFMDAYLKLLKLISLSEE